MNILINVIWRTCAHTLILGVNSGVELLGHGNIMTILLQQVTGKAIYKVVPTVPPTSNIRKFQLIPTHSDANATSFAILI